MQAVHSTVNISRSEFRKNKAHISGGALKLKECITSIEYSVFSDNRADSGGAVYLQATIDNQWGVVTNIRGSNFSSNTAESMGGAIYVESNSIAYSIPRVIIFQETVILSNNFANEYHGGALYLYDGGYNFQVFVQSMLIVANNSVGQGNGGGIFLHWVELTLQKDSTLELMHNNAAENGGGIYAEISTINANFSLAGHGVKWTSIHFFQNHATNGGGLYLCNSQVYSFLHQHTCTIRAISKVPYSSSTIQQASEEQFSWMKTVMHWLVRGDSVSSRFTQFLKTQIYHNTMLKIV